MAVQKEQQENTCKSPHEEYWKIWGDNSTRIKKCCYKWLNGDMDRIEDAMSILAEKSYIKYLSESYQVKNYFSWMYKIAYNICIDMHREEKKEYNLVDHVKHLPDTFYFSSNTSETLEEQIEREQLVNHVLTGLDGLSNDLQKVVDLRLIKGKEYSELAQMFNTSQENVRKKIHIARKALQSYLEKQELY